MVAEIVNEHEYHSILASNPLVIVDFTAKWCGPCQMIAPHFEKFAQQYQNIRFIKVEAYFGKVDVDAQQNIARGAGISAMPTFQFYKNGQKVDELKGADVNGLEQRIKKHAAWVVAGVSVSGVTVTVPGQHDLTSNVDIKQVECLNNKHAPANIFTKDGYLESECDEQLIIVIPFKSAVKVHSLKFLGPVENAPKTIRIYTNRLSLSFDEANAVEPTQVLNLTASDYDADKTIPLRYVKFQNIHQLVLFIEDNLSGSDVTRLDRLIVFGTELEQTKELSELKKLE